MQEEIDMRDDVKETPESERKKFRKIEHISPEDAFDKAEGAEGAEDGDDGEQIDQEMEGDKTPEPGHLIRVGNSSTPNKLAYHIVKCIQEYGIAETQSIGPVALSKAMMAIVRAESIVSQYTTCEKLCVLACIRKPTMRNGEERTAIRLRIVPVHIQHLR